MIFCLRQLQEKCIEQDRPLYMVFVDFSKEFDTVGRTGLWQLLRKYGCPEKFTTMIEALYTGMMANVSVGGEVSELFSVTNGGSSKVVYWPPCSSPSSYQQCLTRLSETWGMASTYSPDRTLCQRLWNNHHVSMRVKARYTVQSCCPPSYMEPRPGQCMDDR